MPLESPKVGARDARQVLAPVEDDLRPREEVAHETYGVEHLADSAGPADPGRVDLLEAKDARARLGVVHRQHQPPRGAQLGGRLVVELVTR